MASWYCSRGRVVDFLGDDILEHGDGGGLSEVPRPPEGNTGPDLKVGAKLPVRLVRSTHRNRKNPVRVDAACCHPMAPVSS